MFLFDGSAKTVHMTLAVIILTYEIVSSTASIFLHDTVLRSDLMLTFITAWATDNLYWRQKKKKDSPGMKAGKRTGVPQLNPS